MQVASRTAELIQKHEGEILQDWVQAQMTAATARPDLMQKAELEDQSREMLQALRHALASGDGSDIKSSSWQGLRDFLPRSPSREPGKDSPTAETATFVFSIKEPIFARLQRDLAKDPAALAAETWLINVLIDKLALHTIEVFQKGREDVIARQQRTMLELSTPVVELWEGILALPLIGTLDSERTQLVMESLLTRIVETGAAIAIIDITGVPTVDTLVAQHLLKTVAAARLMGADCLISGIRPQIAQTIVHLGVELGDVTSKATLAGAFAVALKRTGLSIVRAPQRSA
jgi:rsbT co-antagonist protein RsbR